MLKADLVRPCGTMRDGFFGPFLCGLFGGFPFFVIADDRLRGPARPLHWVNRVAQKVLFPLGA